MAPVCVLVTALLLGSIGCEAGEASLQSTSARALDLLRNSLVQTEVQGKTSAWRGQVGNLLEMVGSMSEKGPLTSTQEDEMRNITNFVLNILSCPVTAPFPYNTGDCPLDQAEKECTASGVAKSNLEPLITAARATVEGKRDAWLTAIATLNDCKATVKTCVDDCYNSKCTACGYEPPIIDPSTTTLVGNPQTTTASTPTCTRPSGINNYQVGGKARSDTFTCNFKKETAAGCYERFQKEGINQLKAVMDANYTHFLAADNGCDISTAEGIKQQEEEIVELQASNLLATTCSAKLVGDDGCQAKAADCTAPGNAVSTALCGSLGFEITYQNSCKSIQDYEVLRTSISQHIEAWKSTYIIKCMLVKFRDAEGGMNFEDGSMEKCVAEFSTMLQPEGLTMWTQAELKDKYTCPSTDEGKYVEKSVDSLHPYYLTSFSEKTVTYTFDRQELKHSIVEKGTTTSLCTIDSFGIPTETL